MRKSERSRIQEAWAVLCPICCLPPLTESYFDTSTSLAEGNSLSNRGSEPVEARVSQQNRGLKCVSINARSLVNKTPEFMAWADTNCYDIIAVTKTWLDDSVLDSELLPSNYNMERRRDYERHLVG